MFRGKRGIRLRTGIDILRILGLTLTATLLLASACDSPTGASEDLSRPPQTGDGWETAPLHSVGMERGPLRNLLELIDGTEDHLIHSPGRRLFASCTSCIELYVETTYGPWGGGLVEPVSARFSAFVPKVYQ